MLVLLLVAGDAFGVCVGEGAQQVGAVKEPGVEEVWGYAAGFEGEGAELEDRGGEAGLEEGLLVRWEGGDGVCY